MKLLCLSTRIRLGLYQHIVLLIPGLLVLLHVKNPCFHDSTPISSQISNYHHTIDTVETRFWKFSKIFPCPGPVLDKSTSLCVNLNLDGEPITSRIDWSVCFTINFKSISRVVRSWLCWITQDELLKVQKSGQFPDESPKIKGTQRCPDVLGGIKEIELEGRLK